MSKKKNNQIALKVNYSNYRIRVQQTNNKKICYITDNDNKIVLERIHFELDKIKEVKSYCNIIDNTQTKHFIVSVEITRNIPIVDIIERIKNNNKLKKGVKNDL